MSIPKQIKDMGVWIIIALCSSPAWAGNGMYMISHGGRYGGLAGASTALGGSVMDLHSSPALIGLDHTAQLEAGIRFNYAKNEYEDQYWDTDPQNYYTNHNKSWIKAPLPYLGFQTPLNDKVAFATALYLVGGGGGEFSGITRLTPTGTSVNEFLGYDLAYGGAQNKLQESVYARMMHGRLATGLSYNHDKLRIGMSLSGAFSRMEMRQLMHDPSNNFELPGTGLRYKSDPAYAMSGGMGIAYDFTNDLRLAYSWSGPTVFHMDGHMRTNTGNPKYYHNNKVSMRMAWPEQHRLGLKMIFGGLAVLLDLGYINWSSYLNTIKFQLDHGAIHTPFGFESNTMVMNLHLRDQVVYSTGMEYKLNPDYTIRMGYNYAKANAQTEGLNPLFSVLTEHHITAGLGINSDGLDWDLALEYAPPGKMSGGNTSNWDLGHAVFGFHNIQTARFSHTKTMSAGALILGISYKWGKS